MEPNLYTTLVRALPLRLALVFSLSIFPCFAQTALQRLQELQKQQQAAQAAHEKAPEQSRAREEAQQQARDKAEQREAEAPSHSIGSRSTSTAGVAEDFGTDPLNCAPGGCGVPNTLGSTQSSQAPVNTRQSAAALQRQAEAQERIAKAQAYAQAGNLLQEAQSLFASAGGGGGAPTTVGRAAGAASFLGFNSDQIAACQQLVQAAALAGGNVDLGGDNACSAIINSQLNQDSGYIPVGGGRPSSSPSPLDALLDGAGIPDSITFSGSGGGSSSASNGPQASVQPGPVAGTDAMPPGTSAIDQLTSPRSGSSSGLDSSSDNGTSVDSDQGTSSLDILVGGMERTAAKIGDGLAGAVGAGITAVIENGPDALLQGADAAGTIIPKDLLSEGAKAAFTLGTGVALPDSVQDKIGDTAADALRDKRDQLSENGQPQDDASRQGRQIARNAANLITLKVQDSVKATQRILYDPLDALILQLFGSPDQN